MIGQVQTINGVKQITPLDDTLIPNISPATPNNSILQYENGVVKSAGYTTNGVVRYVGNFGTMSLSDIWTNYANQNIIMYKGYFDWGDSRCPTSSNGIKDTVEVTCFDYMITAKTINGITFSWTSTNPNWYEMNGVPVKHDLTANITGGWAYMENALVELLNNTGARYLAEGRVYEGAINAVGQFSGTYQIFSYNTNYYLAITGTINNSGWTTQFWGYYTTANGWVIKTNYVYSRTYTVTTDAAGNFYLGGLIGTNSIDVVSVRTTVQADNCLIVPGKDSNGNWWCRCISWTANPITVHNDMSTTVEVWYRLV